MAMHSGCFTLLAIVPSLPTVCIHNNMLCDVDKQCSDVVIVALDRSDAFDTVDNQILLQRQHSSR